MINVLSVNQVTPTPPQATKPTKTSGRPNSDFMKNYQMQRGQYRTTKYETNINQAQVENPSTERQK